MARVFTKKKIRLCCLQILDNPTALPKDKVMAAGILERMTRAKDLARARKRKTQPKNGNQPKTVVIGDILRQVNAA